MRVTIEYISILFFIFSLNSCRENNEEVKKGNNDIGFPIFWYFPENEHGELHGDMQVRAKTIGFGTSQNVNFRAVARFHKDLSDYDCADVGNVIAADYELSETIGNYYFCYGDGPDNRITGTTFPTFGDIAEFKIDGDTTNGLYYFSRDVYIPDILYITDTLDYNIDNDNDLVINWNQDNQNTNKVFIYIEYKRYNHTNDSTMTDDEIDYAIMVPDNGSYTIDSDIIDDFPVNGEIAIYVGRGNQDIFVNNSKDYRILAYTYYHGIHKIVD